jgi:hypothetical protein
MGRVKAKKMGVPLENIFSALQAFFGSSYMKDPPCPELGSLGTLPA